MNKITVTSIGVVLVAVGIVVYYKYVGGIPSSPVSIRDNATGKNVSTTNPAPNRDAPAPTASTSTMPKSTGIVFTCSNGSSFSVINVPVMTLTLKDSQGERSETLTLKPGTSKYAVFQNKSGSVVYTSMGKTATVEENGKATFSNCVAK